VPLSTVPEVAGVAGGENVTLITGQQVRLEQRGRAVAVSVAPGPHPAVPLLDTFVAGGDLYVVPRDAGPYLGTLLDRRLFDVSYLLRAGYAGPPGRGIPVTVTWRRGHHPAGVPGFAPRTAGAATTGVVAKAGAGAFGQALAARFSIDHHLRMPGAARKAAGLVDAATIMLARPAGRAAPLALTPPKGTRLYTLTASALDRTGQPGYARIDIQNLDNLRHYYSVSYAAPGQPVAVSVPAGHYSIEATVNVTNLGGLTVGVGDVSVVVLPDVVVSADTTVTADARTAKPVTITTPKPAEAAWAGLTYLRTSVSGGTFSGGLITVGAGASPSYPALRVFATPVQTPGLGQLSFDQDWALVPPGTQPGGAPRYAYYLDFPDSGGIPSQLAYRVHPADLASVRERYAADPAQAAMETEVPFEPWSLLAVAIGEDDFSAPGSRTDYFGPAPSTVWQPAVATASDPAGIYGVARSYRPGQRSSETWGQTPHVPAPVAFSGPVVEPINGLYIPPFLCPACRQDDNVLLDIAQAGDSNAAHWGPTTFGQEGVDFRRNGTLTQVGDQGIDSAGLLPMLPGRSTYQITNSESGNAASALSTSVDSTWTFTSQRPRGTDKLPPYEYCAPDITRGCSFLPLIFARYEFSLNLSGQAPAGTPETFRLTGYHQPGETGPPVTTAQVQVSFDDGGSWASVPAVAGRDGQFTVAVPAPPAGGTTSGYVSLRVHLADADGNSLDQTIIRAYQLPASQ
jgi:hypothetical protein